MRLLSPLPYRPWVPKVSEGSPIPYRLSRSKKAPAPNETPQPVVLGGQQGRLGRPWIPRVPEGGLIPPGLSRSAEAPSIGGERVSPLWFLRVGPVRVHWCPSRRWLPRVTVGQRVLLGRGWWWW